MTLTSLSLLLLAAPAIWPAKDIKWVDTPAVPGAQMAVLWGDPKAGENKTMKRFPGGLEIPSHKHTHDLHSVVASGTLLLLVEDEPGRELDAGSYAFIPAGTRHSAICKRPGPCIVFEEQPGAADFIPVEGPVPTASATARPTPRPEVRPRGPAAITPAGRRSHEMRQAAAGLLFKRFPDANWGTDNYLAADVTGDGVEELVLVGRGGNDLFIGVAPSRPTPESRAWMVRFGIAADRPDSLCDANVTLTTEAPKDTALAAKGGRGILVDDGRCEPVHILWDPGEQRLRWWRGETK